MSIMFISHLINSLKKVNKSDGIVAFIPARSGSKSIKNKNIKLLKGKPLLAWSIESCIKSKFIKDIIVSTDSKKYAKIAKKYGAVCTPDFFGSNKEVKLQYRGRFRELKDLKPVLAGDSDLKIAMKMISQTQSGPKEQIPSMGCNIKWFN